MKLKYQIMISALLTAVGVYFIFKTKGGKSNTKDATDYTTSNIGNFIITKPNSKFKTYNVLYVFGGKYYATKEWMLKQVPKSILLNNIVIFSNYTSSFSETQKALQNFMSENGLKTDSVSLSGFSAGGINVLSNYDRKYKFIGLIDPSNKAGQANLNFGKNTHMVYNDGNWSSYDRIRAEMKSMANNINQKGGMAEKVNLSHEKIPQYFFNTHQKYLND